MDNLLFLLIGVMISILSYIVFKNQKEIKELKEKLTKKN